MLYRLTAWVAVLALSSTTSAQLAWSTLHNEVNPKPSESAATVIFPFENIGDTPATITSIRSSCGCTTASLPKRTFAPGEGDTLTATFEFGDRVGPQRKTITVTTDDGQTTTLTMRVTIPELIRLRPRLLFWKQGAPAEPKQIKIEVTHDEPIEIKGISTEGEAFNVELITLEPGKRYAINVTPQNTDWSGSSELKLDVAGEIGGDRRWTALARVIGEPKPAESAAAEDQPND